MCVTLDFSHYKRLLFGISSAPQLYQYKIHQLVSDCAGVENISDDIIIHGKNDAEHDSRLKKLLHRLKESGQTVNLSKCSIRLPQLEYVGHLVGARGKSPTGEKIQAIVEARNPQSVSEVRSFLGLLNFSSKFIPNLPITTEPLRYLTRKGVNFKWDSKCQRAFDKLKRDLSSAETLAYFDSSAETEVIVDASPVGLGAMLAQVQGGKKRAICYACHS